MAHSNPRERKAGCATDNTNFKTYALDFDPQGETNTTQTHLFLFFSGDFVGEFSNGAAVPLLVLAVPHFFVKTPCPMVF